MGAKTPFKAMAYPTMSTLMNPFAWFLWMLDFLVWLLTIVGPVTTMKNFFRGSYSNEVDVATRRSAARRSLGAEWSGTPACHDTGAGRACGAAVDVTMGLACISGHDVRRTGQHH